MPFVIPSNVEYSLIPAKDVVARRKEYIKPILETINDRIVMANQLGGRVCTVTLTEEQYAFRTEVLNALNEAGYTWTADNRKPYVLTIEW